MNRLFFSLIEKLHKISLWKVTLFVLFLTETLTLAANSLQSMLWWGEISGKLLLIGTIDAFFVTLLVVPPVVYLLRQNNELERLNKMLAEERDMRMTAETMFKSVIESTPLGIHIYKLQPDGRLEFTGYNHAADRILRTDHSEMYGKDIEEAFPALAATDIPDTFRRSCLGGNSPTGRQMFYKDELISGGLEMSAFKTSEGVMATIFQDITERLELDRERERYLNRLESFAAEMLEKDEVLAREKEQLSITLSSIADGVITTDTQSRIVMINRVAENLTGRKNEEAVGMRFDEVFVIDPETSSKMDKSITEQILSTGLMTGPEIRMNLRSKSGVSRIVSTSGSPIRNRESAIIGVVVVFHDITEKVRLESEMLKQQKLESLGLLAGGIAHDFNNLLTGILGNLSIAGVRILKGADVSENIRSAEHACTRAKDLTHQLLTFSRGGEPIKKTVSVADIINNAVALCLSGSTVRAESCITEDLMSIEADEGQIVQLLNNLLINAEHAMPGGGTINITAVNFCPSQASGSMFGTGNYVKISVADHGHGISKDNLSRIFDPYFTTKKSGSGIGLAISYSIVKRHSGHITVDSELGSGTTFTVYLPASDNKPVISSREKKEPLLKGTGRVLVMDDEEYIRKLAADILKHLGYTVTVCPDGDSALEEYATAGKNGQPFDAVIMDLTVPAGMGGKELMDRLLVLNPKVRGIVSSGYSNDPIIAQHRDYGFINTLRKPYTINEISRVLSESLT